jgi:predicted nucleic acid-binding protein
MNYLLDTCVLSEFTKRQPHSNVVHWVAAADENSLFISALTVGEIKRGIDRLPETHRKEELSVWLNDSLLRRFAGRVIAIDAETMLLWGALTARLENQGKIMSVIDASIAATALHHSLMLVTRNETDFEYAGIMIVNPWK